MCVFCFVFLKQRGIDDAHQSTQKTIHTHKQNKNTHTQKGNDDAQRSSHKKTSVFIKKKETEGIDNEQAHTQKKEALLFGMPLLFTTLGLLRGRKSDQAHKKNDQGAGVEAKKIKKEAEQEHRKTDGDESQHSVPVPPELAAALKQVHEQKRNCSTPNPKPIYICRLTHTHTHTHTLTHQHTQTHTQKVVDGEVSTGEALSKLRSSKRLTGAAAAAAAAQKSQEEREEKVVQRFSKVLHKVGFM